MDDPNSLHIYTDGSSYSSPRRGGMGFVFVFPEYLNKEPLTVKPLGYKKATNNQMEIKACTTALEESIKLTKCWQRIIVHPDSQYVCDYYLKAAFKWRINKWKKSSGAPVANMDQWKELIKAIQKTKTPVDFSWVKSHSKNKYNKMADKLAEKSALGYLKDPLNNVNLRRKLSSKKTEIGSVKMLGQKIRIRIISSMIMPQKTNRYRYEIMSKRSPFYQNVDIIYCPTTLRVGHEFLVKLNNDQKFPQIKKIYRDFTNEKKEKTK
jgi:ribonuclease HI